MGEPPGGSRIVPILGIQWFQQPDLKLIYHDIPCSEDGAKFWCKPVLIGLNRYDPCMIDVLLDLDTHSSQIQTGWDAGVILPSPSETCCQLGHLAPKTWFFAGFPSQKQPVTLEFACTSSSCFTPESWWRTCVSLLFYIFSRACLLRTWVPYVLILAYSGCFLRKMRFTCFSWCFLW